MSDPNQPNRPNQPHDPSEEATRVGPPPASGGWPQQNQPPQSQQYPGPYQGQQYPQQPGQQPGQQAWPQRGHQQGQQQPPQQAWPQQPQGPLQGQPQGQPAYGGGYGGPGGQGGPGWGGGPQGPGSGSGKGLKLGLIIGGAVLALIAAVGLVVGLTGGGDEEASADETTAESTEPTESTEETAESESAAPAGDLTAPGNDLSIGDQAVLPVSYGTDGTGTISLAVTEIVKGTSDDLRNIDLDENPDDYTPYYIKLDMEIVSQQGSGLGSYTPGSDISGLIGENMAGSLIVFGDFQPCNTDGFEYDAGVGDTVSTCVPALAENGGDPVDGVMFSAYDTDYDQFDGDPVTWH